MMCLVRSFSFPACAGGSGRRSGSLPRRCSSSVVPSPSAAPYRAAPAGLGPRPSDSHSTLSAGAGRRSVHSAGARHRAGTPIIGAFAAGLRCLNQSSLKLLRRRSWCRMSNHCCCCGEPENQQNRDDWAQTHQPPARTHDRAHRLFLRPGLFRAHGMQVDLTRTG